MKAVTSYSEKNECIYHVAAQLRNLALYPVSINLYYPKPAIHVNSKINTYFPQMT